MPLTSFDKNHLYKSDKWKFMRTLVDLQTKIDALVDSNYYSFVFSAYWEAAGDNMIPFHWLLWICPIKNHSSRVYSKWMDLKALHDIFSLQHYIEVAKINWTQQFWVGKQFITRKECKFTSLDLIVIMPILFLVVSYGCRNVAIFNKLLQFHVQCENFCIR